MAEEKEYTAAQALQTATQIRRFLKVFQEFERIISVLSTYEMREKVLKRNFEDAEANAQKAAEVLAKLDESIGNAKEELKQVTVEVSDKINTANQELAKVKEEISMRERSARADEAKAREAFKKEQDAASAALAALANEKRQLENSISQMRAQFAAQIQKINDSSKVLVN